MLFAFVVSCFMLLFDYLFVVYFDLCCDIVVVWLLLIVVILLIAFTAVCG